jgi:hypothetical protein
MAARSMATTFVVEFPPETTEVINKIAEALHLERVDVITRGIGLLQVYVEAKNQNRILVEKPASGVGEEAEIEIAAPAYALAPAQS